MKKFSKIAALLLAAVMVLSLAACGGNNNGQSSEEPSISVETTTEKAEDTTTADNGETEPAADAEYERADDEEIYEANMEGYDADIAAAKANDDLDAKFVKMAEAEAKLLDSAIMTPYLTQGGTYTISRIAPHTVPYVQWGNDNDRFYGLVINDELLTKEERADLLELWNAALAGEGEYDPAAYLTEKGHSLKDEYTLTFSTGPVTLDWLNTSSQSDTEILVNTVDGLYEYNNLGQQVPAIAESHDVSDDGLVYTFHLRDDVKWYTAEGTEYAGLTANDFVAGIHHTLDINPDLSYLLGAEGAHIVGADDYAYGETDDFETVGVKALDDYTLEFTLTQPTSYFLTMLSYSIFQPICESFYLSHGGVWGIEECAEAMNSDAYQFGLKTDVATQVYCGAYLLKKYVDGSEIVLEKNPNYYNPDKVRINTIRWIFDMGENIPQLYADVVGGTYAGMGLSTANGSLKLAQDDGNFDKCGYVSDTSSTTYFGGLNLNRGTFELESGACASPKTEQEKIDTHTALQNKNFRKALMHGWNRKAWRAITVGDEVAENAIRNMYVHPQFTVLTKETTDEYGNVFAEGTVYGDIVQFYLDELGAKIKVADSQDGWYDQAAAEEYKAAAIEELGDSVTFPIQIDVVYYSANDGQVAQANGYKTILEENLGKDFVQVNLIEATTPEDYYACGYRAASGSAGNFDMFYGSGWGPDYGDPSTYLDTFLPGGYMIKVVGLDNF